MNKAGNRGRFEIERPIGRGAMGTVYLARDPVIGRRVAIKTVHLDALQDQPAELIRPKLRAEAQAAGILSHPNIVAVYDILEDADERSISIAMEYVEGTDLGTILQRPARLPIETGLELVAQIADGLAYAHGQGVIHRDVKPGNILVTSEGRPKIADFGIAHLIDTALSEELRFLGTPSYLAPERIQGHTVDHRCDIFSLGVVLYEVLTGHQPFEGDTVAAVTRRIAAEEFTPLDRYLPDVPEAVARIVGRALEKDPSRRYGAASEMAADLRRVLSSRSLARQTQPVEPLAEAVVPPGLDTEAALPPPGVPTSDPVAGGGSRVPLFGLAAGVVGALLLAVGVWAWSVVLRSRPAATAGQVAAVTPARAADQGYLTAMREGLALQARGDLATARSFYRTAELLAPEADRPRLLRRAVEWEMAIESASRREIEVLDHVREARGHLAAGRLESASRALAEAREAGGEGQEIADLTTRVSDGRRSLREREAARVEATAAPPPAEPTRMAVAESPAVLELEVPAESSVADLVIELDSERSRGTLTLYSGEEQLFREGFRFVEKTRFLVSRGTSGSMTRRLQVPAGDLDLRVYLALPRVETQVVRVTGHLRGGTERVLKVAIQADGTFTARLR